MNIRGPCSDCGAQLATDQRYCVECGACVGAPRALAYMPPATPAEAAASGSSTWALPIPIQMATTFAALALGFGTVVGTAISPNVAGTIAGPSVVAQAPPGATAPTAPPASVGGHPRAPIATGESAAPADGYVPGGAGGSGMPARSDYKGTVVHVNPRARSYTLSADGAMLAVHDRKLPAPGTKLRVPLEQLANGTYAEDGKRRRRGTAGKATFSGVVSFVEPEGPNVIDADPKTDLYTVSARGASVLVRADDAAAAASPPRVGSTVTVTVEIVDPPSSVPAADPGTPAAPPAQFCDQPVAKSFPSSPLVPTKLLRQVKVEVGAVGGTSSVIETVVQATCPATGQLLISADDVRESALDMTVSLGPGIELTKLAPGKSVIATGSFTQDPGAGGMVLSKVTGIADDVGKGSANNRARGQGDLATTTSNPSG